MRHTGWASGFLIRCWKFTRDHVWKPVCCCCFATVPNLYSMECLRMTKRGSCMRLPSIPAIGCHTRIISLTAPEHLCTHSRFCFLSNEKIVKWFSMSWYHRVKKSLRICTRRYWNMCNRHYKQREPELINRNGVLFLNDNTIQNAAYGWETLCYTPYTPEHATSDFYFSTPWTIIFVDNPSWKIASPMKQDLATHSRDCMRSKPAREFHSW